MQSLITFASSHTKLQTEAILTLGELVKKPVLEQMEEAGRRRGWSVIGDDILFISVPKWLYDALAAVEKREVPTIIGRPLRVGASEEIVATFRAFEREEGDAVRFENLSKEQMLDLLRRSIDRIESGEIEPIGIVFFMPFNRVHESPIRAMADDGTTVTTDRTFGMASDVALPHGGAPEKRKALRDLMEQGIRGVAEAIRRELGSE